MPADNDAVPMDVFLDFAFAVGKGRLRAMRRDADNSHSFDFYEPLQSAIVSAHADERPMREIESFAHKQEDLRRAGVFPGLVADYRRFLSSQGKAQYFAPPSAVLTLSGARVEVAAHVGLQIGGEPHAIRYYWKKEQITGRRVDAEIALMAMALGDMCPGATFAVLDVRNAKLYAGKAADSRMLLVLRGDGAAWSEIAGVA